MARLHASQLPVHAWSQHTPSAQNKPDPQSVVAAQSAPFARGWDTSGGIDWVGVASGLLPSGTVSCVDASSDGRTLASGTSSGWPASTAVDPLDALGAGPAASPATCSSLPRIRLHPVTAEAKTRDEKSQERVTTQPSIELSPDRCRLPRGEPKRPRPWAP